MRIMIVDDEPMVLEETKEIVQMTKPKAEIISAGNYIQALDLAKEIRIDVIFLDIEMPGMNGLELAKRLKDIYSDTNIVFVTAYSQYAIDAFDMFASGYLIKPITRRFDLCVRDLWIWKTEIFVLPHLTIWQWTLRGI